MSVVYITDVTLSLPVVLADGEWHTVNWRTQGTQLVLDVNGTTTSSEAGFSVHGPDMNSTAVVYLGARPYIPGKFTLVFLPITTKSV